MKSLTDWIDHYLEIFPHMTKEEADIVEEFLKWDEDRKAGFLMAKRIFEEEE